MIYYIGISYAAQALLRFLILTCVLAHWMACLWGFNGQRMSIETDTWHIKLPKTFDAFTAGPAASRNARQVRLTALTLRTRRSCASMRPTISVGSAVIGIGRKFCAAGAVFRRRESATPWQRELPEIHATTPRAAR